jgi:hypothetical protein
VVRGVCYAKRYAMPEKAYETGRGGQSRGSGATYASCARPLCPPSMQQANAPPEGTTVCPGLVHTEIAS